MRPITTEILGREGVIRGRDAGGERLPLILGPKQAPASQEVGSLKWEEGVG